jgi:hypothetical protein
VVSSAEPVPEVPPVSALGLFDQAGCPACRQVAEETQAYLAWLALDGHRDADVLNRLTASLGMCAMHTCRLLAQPGAAARLVPVYRRVIEAAAGDVATGPAVCPACEHAASAADQMFGYLLGVATRGDRRTYKQHGGLCLPHLRGAAVARRGADILWLVRFMIVRLTAEPPSLDVLAGHPGKARALVLPALPTEDPEACVVCTAAAEAARSERGDAAAECLCPQHLREQVTAAGYEATELLAEQAALHAARLHQVVDGRARSLGNYLSVRARRALADPDCPACRGAEAVRTDAITDVARARQQPAAASAAEVVLCLRHARNVHAVDQRAVRNTKAYLSHRGQQVLRELTAVADNDVAGHLTGSAASAMTAVRRAAVFLDGSVFGVGAVTNPPGSEPNRQVQQRSEQWRRGSP